MIDYEFSEHAYDMLKERAIRESWVKLTMENPDSKEVKDDGTIHYIKSIKEYKARHLRIVINPNVEP